MFRSKEDGGLVVEKETDSEESDSVFLRKFRPGEKKVQYLSCHRVGPQNVYAKNMTMEEGIGTDGRYAIAYLNQHHMDVIEPEFCKGNIDYTLLGQVNWWLSYIADAEISTEEILGADLIKASYTMYDAVQIRPVNIVAISSSQ